MIGSRHGYDTDAAARADELVVSAAASLTNAFKELGPSFVKLGQVMSTRADLLRRLDRRDESAAAYTRALELSTVATERRYLERRLVEISET